MSSTTVRSENNQMKTEVTGMSIVFNTREKEYKIEAGQALNKVLRDHIQEQGEMGINVENGYVNSNNNIETKDGIIMPMKNKDAFKNIKEHQKFMNKMKQELMKKDDEKAI